jgi:hypothetical protein
MKGGTEMTTNDLKKTKVAGKMTFNFTQLETFEIGDIEAHIVSLRKAEGKNTNTGKPEFMDGANAVNFSFDDLVKGTGLHQGYSKMEKNGDLVISKWEGRIVTTFSTDGKPIPSFSGTMYWIKATGHFANMHGGGSYKGHFTSETSYDVEWEGEYWFK